MSDELDLEKHENWSKHSMRSFDKLSIPFLIQDIGELIKEVERLRDENIKLFSKRDYWMALYREANSDELYGLVGKMGSEISRLREKINLYKNPNRSSP